MIRKLAKLPYLLPPALYCSFHGEPGLPSPKFQRRCFSPGTPSVGASRDVVSFALHNSTNASCNLQDTHHGSLSTSSQMFLDRKTLQSSPSLRSYRVLSKSLSAVSPALLLAVYTFGGFAEGLWRGWGFCTCTCGLGSSRYCTRHRVSSSFVETSIFSSDCEDEVFPLYNILPVLCALITCDCFVFTRNEERMT